MRKSRFTVEFELEITAKIKALILPQIKIIIKKKNDVVLLSILFSLEKYPAMKAERVNENINAPINPPEIRSRSKPLIDPSIIPKICPFFRVKYVMRTKTKFGATLPIEIIGTIVSWIADNGMKNKIGFNKFFNISILL